MADKIIVFAKQTDEQRVPITVRIEWLADGTIKPLLYWTPDGSCYAVKHIYETTPIAFLKDGGAGLRIKALAELTETPETYTDDRLTRHETYLYFADNWFCGKNIIDARYGHTGKEFITVTIDVFPDCNYEIVYFTALDARYMVEKTLAVEPRGSFNAGGVGIWHKVEARRVNAHNDEDADPPEKVRHMVALYFEINKWFVAVRTA